MSSPRCYAPDVRGSHVELPVEEGHHLARVLRLPVGAPVVLFDGRGGQGHEWSARLASIDRNRVVVEGVNLRWKHKKPSQKNPKGERTQVESAIHASNVMLIDPKTDEPVRRRPVVEEKKKGAKPKSKKKEASAAS